ncbi:MAG: hypothetical protein A2632_00540 [Candidatus Pacebacteria bacterium RIFCSPHIGHO2_01_FULL_46_16]|nr:MAG: hypothetical protein A2632_00540 [Candidatus Pacebacteria bacterium RIFCSPHIGHO2_01_FULL_46_16]OGJ38714.1 MAG: hypothetical protein A3A82_03225 [Candidatus Pacebacteria bacterium RIFCSPLOWO2_01_FULL_47_12]
MNLFERFFGKSDEVSWSVALNPTALPPPVDTMDHNEPSIVYEDRLEREQALIDAWNAQIAETQQLFVSTIRSMRAMQTMIQSLQGKAYELERSINDFNTARSTLIDAAHEGVVPDGAIAQTMYEKVCKLIESFYVLAVFIEVIDIVGGRVSLRVTGDTASYENDDKEKILLIRCVQTIEIWLTRRSDLAQSISEVRKLVVAISDSIDTSVRYWTSFTSPDENVRSETKYFLHGDNRGSVGNLKIKCAALLAQIDAVK